VGSCALIAIVHDGKLYVANCGDSKAVILRTAGESSFEAIKCSTTFSANKKSEQTRLAKQFSKERDVVVCKNPKACYVKGGIMPTRSIGDLRLKKKEFNFHDFAPEYGYLKPIPNFTGPYITSEPDVQVHKLTDKDKYLVLASDGLWDEVKRS